MCVGEVGDATQTLASAAPKNLSPHCAPGKFRWGLFPPDHTAPPHHPASFPPPKRAKCKSYSASPPKSQSPHTIRAWLSPPSPLNKPAFFFFTSSTELLTTPLSRLSWVNLGHSYMKASDTMPSIRDAYGAGAAVGPRIIARRVGRRRGLPAEHRFPISVRPLLASNREPIVTRGAMALLLISSASYTSSRAPYILDSFHLCRRCLFGSWLYHTLFPVSRCTRTS